MPRNIDEGSSAAGAPCEDARCGCGSLLARMVANEVELKCRRCKRVWRLAVEGAPQANGARWRMSEGPIR